MTNTSGRIVRSALSLSLALASLSTGQEAPPTFPAQLEQVTVDVVVTDGKGTPIPGLKAEDLRILEDGVPQAIVSFESFQVPAAKAADKKGPSPRVSTNTDKDEGRNGRTFVIVFDDIHTSAYVAQRAKGAIASFLREGTRDGDRVTIATTGTTAWWSARMEAGREALVDVVKGLQGRFVPDAARDHVSDYEAMRIYNFHDSMILNRVQRRFETMGIETMTQQSQHVQNMMAVEDPYVTSRATEVYYTATSRNRASLAALQRSLDALVDLKGRKSMILVSEGFIYDPHMLEFKRVIDASRRANTAIYFLNSRGLEGLPLTMTAEFGAPLPPEDIGSAFTAALEDTEGSESLAADSGGFTVRDTNDLSAGLARIGEETRAYYLVGYNPKNTTRDGTFRKIDVKVVGRKGTRVRARRGYYAPSDSKTPLTSKGRVETVFQKALDAPYPVSDIPLRMTHYVREETLLGKARVLVATEVDIRDLGFDDKAGHRTGSVQFLMVAVQRGSGENFRYDQTVDLDLVPATYERMRETGLPIVRDFELGPGWYQAKIVVRDKATERVGTVVHDFQVPDPREFRASTPVLSDVRDTPPEGQAGEGLAILARRDFSQQASLYCQLEVYGATREEESRMPKVSMGYEVRRSDGLLYTRDAPSRITPGREGGLSRLIGFPLQAAPPGDYELVMKVKDEYSGKTLELREPFHVSPPPGEPGQP